MEYSSALKRNVLVSHEKTWRNLKCIVLSERSQSEKATYSMIPTIGRSGKGKTTERYNDQWSQRQQEDCKVVKLLCMIL